MTDHSTDHLRVALVSGGSRGLGLRIVEHLLDGGYAVGTFARSPTDAMERLGADHADRFQFTACDSRDYASLKRFVSALVADHGSLDVLVNNAAIGQDHLLSHTPPDVIQAIVSINIEAPIMLTRMVIRHMLMGETPGRIVNISSICGSQGYPGLTTYSASKGAMDAFTRSLAREVGSRGIMVNSIAPGFFESDMSSVLSADQLATIKRRTPTGVLTEEDQITSVLDLLLEADTNITGQTIYVDGGVTS